MSNKPGVYMPTPEGFAEAASGMSLKEACRHWKVGETLMRRWRRESGLARFNPNAFRAMPPGFFQISEDMSLKEICSHWKCGKAVARRWCKEAGIVIRTTLTPEQIQHLRHHDPGSSGRRGRSNGNDVPQDAAGGGHRHSQEPRRS